MSENSKRPNTLFWIVGIIALLWNAMGVNAYIQQAYQTQSYLETTPKAMQDIAANSPAWVTAIFAIAVFVSTLASILLLFRKNLSKLLFLVGLLAVIIQTINATFTEGMFDAMDTFNLSMFIVIPLVSFFLYFYSKSAGNKGWLS